MINSSRLLRKKAFFGMMVKVAFKYNGHYTCIKSNGYRSRLEDVCFGTRVAKGPVVHCNKRRQTKWGIKKLTDMSVYAYLLEAAPQTARSGTMRIVRWISIRSGGG